MDKLGDFISRQRWLKLVESALGTVADTLFLKDDGGRGLVGPATYQQPCFEVRVRDGEVEVRAPRGMVANPY